jgi:ABC-type nitrate/sulfonate/bicarbonate transport system substrate-binding protein
MRLNRREVLAGTVATLAAPALISRANAASGSINLGWIRQFATAGIVQKEVELAKAVGLTVNQVGFNRGLDGLIAMQKGDIDMTDTLIGYTQVCVALSQGIDVTLVSGTSLGLTEILIAPKLLPSGSHDEKNRAYTGANAWELLKGKSIGGARGSQQEYHLRAYLKENNIDFEKDIKFVDLKTNTDQVLALRQGSIDAACVIEPTAIQARMEGYAALLTFGYDKARVTALNAGVLVRTDFLLKNRDIVQAFVDTHVKTMNLYKNDRALWAKETAAVTLFNPEALAHLMDPADLGLDPKYWENLDVSEKLPVTKIQQLAKTLFNGGAVPKDVSDEIPKHIDYSFLEKTTGMSKEQLGG